MEELKNLLNQPKYRRANPHLHSDLHALVDEVRTRFSETADKGPGSFSFYLGFFKRLGVNRVRQLLGEIEESNASDPKRLFWWKVKQITSPQEKTES